MVLAYHFTGPTLRDDRPLPPIGEWLVHDGPLVPCERGLHASIHPFDALQYAPGVMLHRVELGGTILEHGTPPDKLCAERRRILQTIDATALLWAFARWCAIKVLHLWEAPEVVRRYLATGDEGLRDAVRDAARGAVGDAARAAVGGASGNAVNAAAQAAALATAGDATLDAQRTFFLTLVEAAFAVEETT